jgi:hypothetical protein
VVENHLNMIRPSAGNPSTFLHVIAAIFNTKALDIAFRCISGSVAVSAFELNTLPLPSPDDMKAIETLLQNEAAREMVEETVARIYGVENWFVSEPDKIVILKQGGKKKALNSTRSEQAGLLFRQLSPHH